MSKRERGYLIAFSPPGTDDIYEGEEVDIPIGDGSFVEVFDDKESALESLREAKRSGTIPAPHYVRESADA